MLQPSKASLDTTLKSRSELTISLKPHLLYSKTMTPYIPMQSTPSPRQGAPPTITHVLQWQSTWRVWRPTSGPRRNELRGWLKNGTGAGLQNARPGELLKPRAGCNRMTRSCTKPRLVLRKISRKKAGKSWRPKVGLLTTSMRYAPGVARPGDIACMVLTNSRNLCKRYKSRRKACSTMSCSSHLFALPRAGRPCIAPCARHGKLLV